jgi:hypothetical protein
MSDSRSDGSAAARGGRQHHRPVPLLFEPPDPDAPDERFFDLESIDDPGRLLGRSTELALAFRAAAERATDFQALAAARLADPRRFDRLSPDQIADRAGWSEDYTLRLIAYGRDLERSSSDADDD